VKETHRESTNLQALATTSEDRDVTCFCNETNDPIDICAIDALHRATEIVHDAREASRSPQKRPLFDRRRIPRFGKTGCGDGRDRTCDPALGDYHKTSLIETFTASAADRHPTDLAGSRGARLVTSVETEEGRRWAESKIKSLTGGDRISARFMRQDFFEFTPIIKLVVAGNHKPGL
jgi:hypothetical protein